MGISEKQRNPNTREEKVPKERVSHGDEGVYLYGILMNDCQGDEVRLDFKTRAHNLYTWRFPIRIWVGSRTFLSYKLFITA